MVMRLAHLGFQLTLLKTEAEAGLVQQCQDVARDPGRAGGLQVRMERSWVGAWGPRARRAQSLLSGGLHAHRFTALGLSFPSRSGDTCSAGS